MSLKTLGKIYLIGVTNRQTDGTTTAPQSRGSSPPRRGPQGFNMISSRPATPNVFDSVTGSNHSINTNFTNGALGNIPVLPPNHNFSTGAPASTADDALMTSPGGSPTGGVNIVTPPRGRDRVDAIMSSPSRNGEDEDTAMGSPHRTRDEERAAHNASLAARLHREREEREKREHEERKAQAARDHEAMLQAQRDYDLGDFEPDEPADGNMGTTTNNTALADTNMGNAPNGNVTNSNPPADDNMDTEPTGTSSRDADMANSPAGIATPRPTSGLAPSTPDGMFSPLIRGSAREIALLRTRLGNANGAYDEIYRNRDYVNADALDDGGEPVFY